MAKKISKKKSKTIQNVIKISLIIILSALGLYYILKDDPKSTFQVLSEVKALPLIVVILTILALLSIDGLVLTILAKRYNKKYTFFQGTMNAQIGNFIASFSKTSSNFIQAYTFTKQDIKGPNAASILTMNYLVYQLIFVLYSLVAAIIGFPIMKDVPLGLFNNSLTLFPLSMIGLTIGLVILAAIILLSTCKPIHRFFVNFIVTIYMKLHLSDDEEEIRKKWTIRFVTYRLEITKLLKNKWLLLVLIFVNILKQLVTNCLPLVCLWALKLNIQDINIFYLISSSSYLQLISSYIPAGGAEVAYQATYLHIFSSVNSQANLSSLISASNILWRTLTFYFNLIVGGLCFIFYKGTPKRDEMRYNTATIFDLEVINFDESADDKTREFTFDLNPVKKEKKTHSKKQLLSEEDVKKSFFKIRKYMNDLPLEETIVDNQDTLEEQKKQLAEALKESEELLKQRQLSKEVTDLTSKELEISQKRRNEKEKAKLERKRNKDKKMLEKLQIDGTNLDISDNGIKINGPEIYEEKTNTTSDPDEEEDYE